MRLRVLLLFSLLSCTALPVAGEPTKYFGQDKILLYAELRDATYGWIGDSPTPSNIVGVYYGNSIGFEGLYDALGRIIEANEAGQHKAISAIVTGDWKEEAGHTLLWITSAADIEIVDLPPELIAAWEEASKLPELRDATH